MSIEKQIQGISATITAEDTANALPHDEQLLTYMDSMDSEHSFDSNVAALEHLFASVNMFTDIRISTEACSSIISVAAEPTTLSMESIKENLTGAVKKFIDGIMRIIRDVGARITTWTEQIKQLMPSVLKSIQTLREKVESLQGSVNSTTHTNPAGLARLAIHNRVPRNGSEVHQSLLLLVKASAALYGRYAELVLELDGKLHAVLSQDLAGTDGKEYLIQANDVVLKHHALNTYMFPVTRVEDDVRYSETPPLPDNRRLVSSWAIVDKLSKDKGTTPFEMAKAIQKASVRLESTAGDGLHLTPNASLFKTMTKDEMLALLDDAAALLSIRSTFDADIQPKLAKQVSESLSVLEYLEKNKLKGIELDGTIPMADAKYLHAILSYHSALARWAGEPFQHFGNYVLEIVNATLRLVRESATHYE